MDYESRDVEARSNELGKALDIFGEHVYECFICLYFSFLIGIYFYFSGNDAPHISICTRNCQKFVTFCSNFDILSFYLCYAEEGWFRLKDWILRVFHVSKTYFHYIYQ